jgi:hypothetical protein
MFRFVSVDLTTDVSEVSPFIEPDDRDGEGL